MKIVKNVNYDNISIVLTTFLFIELLVLVVTMNLSHVSEHILIAAIIGYISLSLFIYVTDIPIFSIGWYSGTIYYLGREVRDYEKSDKGFDYGGFLGPAIGNIITFYVSYKLYSRLKNKTTVIVSNV